MGHLSDGQTNPKNYINQTFIKVLDEYYIDDADNSWILLSFDNPPNPNQRPIYELKSIDLKSGYYLCHYDGHNGDWMLWHYDSKAEAKSAYKTLYMRCFRNQNWYWIIRIK